MGSTAEEEIEALVDLEITQFVPFISTIEEDFVNGKREWREVYRFRPLVSNKKDWYKLKIVIDESLFDLKKRLVRSSCSCNDHRFRRGKDCKHIIRAKAILRQFVEFEE